jgi:hypothetical protein
MSIDDVAYKYDDWLTKRDGAAKMGLTPQLIALAAQAKPYVRLRTARRGSRLNDDIILRRLDFLLNEAKQPNPIADQIVDLVIRQLGNYLWAGGDSSVHENCPFRSKAAHEGFQQEKVRIEHWEPTSQVWRWMLTEKDLSAGKVKARVLRWPIVVVTKAEHDCLSHSLEPEKRYPGIISEFFIRCDNEWRKVGLQELMKCLELANGGRLDSDVGCDCVRQALQKAAGRLQGL